MLIKPTIILSFVQLFCVSLFSQVKTLQAVKANISLQIDGVLNEEIWNDTIPVATGFIQYFPEYGNAASQKTEVKVIYDNTAIYIGAHLYDDPALIRKQITARDDEQQKDLDYFSVFLDTYNDKQNGFQFLVTSSNVQTDARILPNQTYPLGEFGDKTWDAVWESKVSIVNDGWIVEMKIPYLAIRFAKREIQNWGIQFLRSVRRNNELTFWNPVNPNINGLINQFGQLESLKNISPPLRLSFSPYVSTGLRSTPEKGALTQQALGSGGMDIKYGLNESFTLDATLIPDFGQVVSDNLVNNLTPYEIRFTDYRPFFTEGTDIFNKAGLFYSRRIGGAPSRYQDIMDSGYVNPGIEIIKNPSRSQLYNAIKFSGRTQKKLGIGILNAVSAPMYATIRNISTDTKTRIQTDPLANYNIIVLDQGLKNRSYVTFTNTNVIRNGFDRDANVTGLDFSIYDKSNRYNIKGYAHYSKVFAQSAYDGYNTSLRFGKVSGKLQYFFQNIIRSDNYDPRDLGYLQTANQVVNIASVGYNQFTPTNTFLKYSYALTVNHYRLYKPSQFNLMQTELRGTWLLKNFWDVSLALSYLPDQHDYFLLGSPFTKYARRPQYGAINVAGSTDSRKKLFFNYDLLTADFFKNPEKKYWIIDAGLRYRFSNKFSLDLSHRYETETDYIISAGRNSMGEPRIAFVDLKDANTILSGIYNFTSRINLTLRARHYWSHVPVKRIVYVDDKGNPLPAMPLIASNQTININYFNVDAFLTWDFQYGNRIILGYKNWLGADESTSIDGLQYRRYFSNFGKTFDLLHGNEFTMRFIYFFDYNKLRR